MKTVELPATWWELLDVRMLDSAVSRLKLPPRIVDGAMREPRLAIPLAANKTLDPSTLQALAELHERRSRHLVLRALAANPASPPYLLDALSHHDYEGVVRAVAHNRACPADLLARLARHDDPQVRTAVAANPASPPEVLAVLVDDADFATAADAVANLATAPEAIRHVGERHPHALAKRAMLEDPAPTIPHDLDGPLDVWLALACRRTPPLPEAAQRQLASAEFHMVRLWVALNPATAQAVLIALLCDPDWTVRLSAARNPTTPVEALAQLRPGDMRTGETAYLACRVLGPVLRAHPALVEPAAALLAAGFAGTYAELGVAAAATT